MFCWNFFLNLRLVYFLNPIVVLSVVGAVAEAKVVVTLAEAGVVAVLYGSSNWTKTARVSWIGARAFAAQICREKRLRVAQLCQE